MAAQITTNEITWHGRKLFTTLTNSYQSLSSASPSLVILQTPLTNHILLLQYDLSPLLVTHFLIKCMYAMFYRGEKLLWRFGGSPVCREDALPTGCRSLLKAPGLPLHLNGHCPHPMVGFLALFLQHFQSTPYLHSSTSLLLYSKGIQLSCQGSKGRNSLFINCLGRDKFSAYQQEHIYEQPLCKHRFHTAERHPARLPLAISS